MKIESDQDIDELIRCPKIIFKPPNKEMIIKFGCLRNDIELYKEDDEDLKFSVFIRINERFRENFSIGLRVYPKGNPSMHLLRFNGKHGEYKDFVTESTHFEYHIHRATVETISDKLPYAEVTDRYASYEEALKYFLEYTNIINSEKYFKISSQLSLFPKLEEGKE